MNGFLTDLRFGIHQLTAKPGFVAAAILTLALGIGANTAVFSVLSGYLFKPLPYPHAGRLAQLNTELPKFSSGDSGISMPMYQIVQRHTKAFAAGAVYHREYFNLNAARRAQRVGGLITTASLFRVLGVQPMLGHTFTKADMKPGSDQVVVISYSLWRTTFGADPNIIGKAVNIESEDYRIVGVMPRGFAFPDHDISIWLPQPIVPKTFDPTRFLSALDTRFIGWLKPGVSIATAQRQVRQAVQTWTDNNFPIKVGNLMYNRKLLKSMGFSMRAQSYRQGLLGNRPATLWLLEGAVLLILLITCVNVANLLLSRILGRGHEIAIRSTLGATRGALARQLLGEALCLTVPGGLIGFGLAWFGMHFLAGSALGVGSSIFDIALDWRVGLFALGAALVTAALISVLPIRQLAKTDLQTALQEGSRSTGGRGAKRVRNTLVIAELSLATGLLAMAGLVLHSFMNLEAVDPGFRKDHVLIAQLLLSPKDYLHDKAMSQFYNNVVKRVDGLPGVWQSGITASVPMSNMAIFNGFTIPGRPPQPSGESPGAIQDFISPGYFKTLGIPILRGRRFDERDAGKMHAIVDARVAKKYFRGVNPIGQKIDYGAKQIYTIVGVVPPVKYTRLSQPKLSAAVYIDIGKYSVTPDMYLVIHTKLPPAALIKPVQNLLATIAPNVAVADIHTMRAQLLDSLNDNQTTMTLLLAFGGIALALAIVGVYAVMSYAVGQRRAECGVRLAFGALPGDLQWLILKDGLKLLAVGLVLGLGLAVLCGFLISSQLFGVVPFDPLTLIGSALMLCAITLMACWLPARRAAKLDPAVAMMDQ
ncbi:MAG TPA: ABC transporter permease [Gammaproteobacteria bacterium]|nr:ABC transporter permease [Gammaproteobacteria bacterium]